MPKGRHRARIRITDQNMAQAVNTLKKLHRRVGSGKQVPFLVATIEPYKAAGMDEPIASPIISSRGMADPRCKQLVGKLLEHLEEQGIIKVKRQEGESDDGGLEVELT